MHVTDRSKTVVMLIDWDNLQICHSRDAPGTELDLQALIALAQSYGTLVSARAYAEWNLLSERLAVYKAGIEPVFAPVMRPEGSPREGKSLADTVMVADGVDLLWTVAPDVFVLATSDKDMIPLARIAKQRGAAVVVLGSDLTAIPLVEMSNVFITYRQLLRELDRVTELEAPVGRAPARERRLRESRRPSSEPYGGGLGHTGGLGGGQLGSTGRGGPRPVGTMGGAPSPAAPLPSPAGPRRRLQEPMPVPVAPPSEPERPFAAPNEGPFSEEAAEPLGIGNADVAPRRRRRRGGRGRRSGMGGLGDADGQAETLHDSVDEADESETDEHERGSGNVVGSSPDDIDSAVLQLLAARDRDQSPPPAADTASEADEPAVVPAPAESASATVSAEPEPPAQPRRVVRTSFSSFGPPEMNLRPLTPAPIRPEPPTPAESPAAGEGAGEEGAGEATGTGALASPADEPTPAVTDQAEAATSEAAAPETTGAEVPATEPFASAVASDAPADMTADAANGTAEPEAAPAASARPSRSGRSSRTGTSRRSRGSGSSATSSASTDTAPAEGAAEASSEGSADAARAPRRRRTRRPASAATEGASEPAVGEPIASEAGA
jgi:hypothetical protein